MEDIEHGDHDQRVRELQREYLEYFDDEEGSGVMSCVLESALRSGARLVPLDMGLLRARLAERARGLGGPGAGAELRAATLAMHAALQARGVKQPHLYRLAPTGTFGALHLTPRSLSARHLGALVCVEGVVSRAGLVRPRLARSVHYCPATRRTLERAHHAHTDALAGGADAGAGGGGGGAAYPTRDDAGNPLETEYGLCTYTDQQSITVQELPEKAPAGQLPRALDVLLEGELVDSCKPGDRVHAVGLYRPLPYSAHGLAPATFRTTLLAANVVPAHPDDDEPERSVTRDDIARCKRIVRAHQRRPDALMALLADSLAPSIHGHEQVKRALVCLLLGGQEKTLANGTRLRGDVNVLLIGDPSVAKSQLLRACAACSGRALLTTGRGASGVGLTAAVTVDRDGGGGGGGGERRLEAGACVLADRGLVAIDEFDKMSDADRTAIHEVMEQGRVTIAKAGVHATLNARCAVLAAANPVYGRYDPRRSPADNIGLQDSLLSRFDLVYVLLDRAHPEQDAQVAEHVLRVHQYRAPHERPGDPMPLGGGAGLLRTGPGLGAAAAAAAEGASEAGASTGAGTGALPVEGLEEGEGGARVPRRLLRTWVRAARLVRVKLGGEAAQLLAGEYARLRGERAEAAVAGGGGGGGGGARTMPVTARTLETLIRLASAHARARLAPTVNSHDAHSAIRLLNYAYYKKVQEEEQEKAGAGAGGGGRRRARPAHTAKRRKPEGAEREGGAGAGTQPGAEHDADCDPDVVRAVMERVSALYRAERASGLPRAAVLRHLLQDGGGGGAGAGGAGGALHEAAAAAALRSLHARNYLMEADDMLYLI